LSSVRHAIIAYGVAAKGPHAFAHSYMRHKRALYIRKRTMYLHRRALYFYSSALRCCKRAKYVGLQAWGSNTWCGNSFAKEPYKRDYSAKEIFIF